MTGRTKQILFAAVALLLPAAAFAEVVFDPSNYAEAVLQVNDDIQLVEQLQQQVQNGLAMIKGWNFTELPGILQSMGIWQQVFGQAGATYSSDSPGTGLNNQYPPDPSNYANLSDASYQSMQSGWNQEERNVLVENRTIQNQTYLYLQPTAQRIQADVQHSNAAAGPTSAVQAGNEEVATLVAQVQTLQAAEITDARAEVERDAQEQAEEAYAEAQRQAVRGDWENPQQPSSSLADAFPTADQ